MRTHIENGWVVTSCDASDSAKVFMALGSPGNWRPAFRDWSGGDRVAKIRAAGTGTLTVFLRVGSNVTTVGRVSI